MLIAGVALRNIPYINVAKDIDPSWSSALRSIALVVILLKAGLELDASVSSSIVCLLIDSDFLVDLARNCGAILQFLAKSTKIVTGFRMSCIGNLHRLQWFFRCLIAKHKVAMIYFESYWIVSRLEACLMSMLTFSYHFGLFCSTALPKI